MPRSLSKVLVLPFLAASCATNSALERYLDDAATRYSESTAMIGTECESPNYHTRIATGIWVHPTLDSLDYALALLARGHTADRARANSVVRAVVALQESAVSHRFYGVWPWFREEGVDQMAPPDRNWADFCGARLAQILVDHQADLDSDTNREVRAALHRAGRAIQRRDSNPGYTNIAIMGAVVTAAAGELLHDPALLVYGRRKMQRVVEHAAYHSNFTEYNSPNYTLVALWECERALHLVRDPATRAAAARLHRLAWQTIASSFHPPTQQWAGPHSRAYQDRLSRPLAAELAARLGMPIPVHPEVTEVKPFPFWTTPILPCPADLLPRFHRLPRIPTEIERTFFRDESGGSVIGTTYMDEAACLGSVNRSCLWVQRRPLLGYFRTDQDTAVTLRLRALKNGKDFAALSVHNEQSGRRVQSTFHVLRDRGDWHRHLDKPEASVYRARDLRIRYELSGRGVTARAVSDHEFELRCGTHRVRLTTAHGEFFGQSVRFELGRTADGVYLDAILHTGQERSFDFKDAAAINLHVGLELSDSEVESMDANQLEQRRKNWTTRFSAQ